MDEIFDACLEEVALEGLDGITVNAFWMRLENREPKFCLKLDVFSKTAIWERLSTSLDIEFFKLPAARDLPTLPTEIRKLDPVTGIILVKKPANYKNVYPAHIISNEKYGIYGSCSTYWARKNITGEIRDEQNKKKSSLDEVVKRYGDTLVMVASQKVRMKVLLGSETSPSKELTDAQFTVLEWIGRSRHYGVFQSDTVKELQIDHKTAHYYRNWLSHCGYVTSQQVLKLEDEKSFVRVNLVFLKWKTVQQPHSRYDLISVDISKYLENTPHHIAPMEDVKTHVQKKHKLVDYDMFRRNISIMKQMGYIEKYMLPHNLVKGYSRSLVHNQSKEIMVGCLRLVKVFRIENEEEEPEQVEFDIRDSILYKGRSGVDQVHDYVSQSYLQDGRALTQTEITQSLKLSKLYIRSILRRLESQKAITTTLIDSGRQKAHVFLPVNHPRDVSNLKSGSSPDTAAVSQSKENTVNETDGDNTSVAKVSLNFSQARMEKRKKIMLQVIHIKKAMIGVSSVLKEIRESENAEGLKTKVDRKTLKRLLKKMSLANEINEFCVDIGTEHGQTCKLTLYTAKDLTVDDPRVQALITQEEFHRTGRNVNESRPMQKIKLAAEEEAAAAKVNLKEEKKDEDEEVEDADEGSDIDEACNSSADGSQLKDDKDAKPMSISFEGGHSQHLPKMPRLRLFHEFLWYIVYGVPAQYRDSHRKRKNDGSKGPDSSAKVPRRSTDEEITKGEDAETERVTDKSQKDNQELQIDEDKGESKGKKQEKILKDSVEKKEPTIYRNVDDWRRFVAPLPRSKDMIQGWFILGDVIQRMPLSIFIQLTCKESLLENVTEFLNHPVKMHYPINKLPKYMRKKIQVDRSFIQRIEHCLLGLCRFGLLWLAPHSLSVKEERMYFLCKKAKLKDTTSSDVDYMRVSEKSYPEIWYQFDTFLNVTKYWYDFMLYSLNTPLGVCKAPRGISVGLRQKEEITVRGLVQTWKSTSTKPDNEGNILGDGRGACGMDSSSFTHLKRNWIGVKIVPDFRSQMIRKKLSKKNVSSLKTGERLKGLGPSANKNDASSTRVSIGASKTLHIPIVKKQVSSDEYKKSNKGGKGLKRKKNKGHKPKKALKTSQPKLKQKHSGEDELDQLARMRAKRQRCMWSSKEDNFILMCCITSAILDKKVNRCFVPWKEIRNIFHKRYEAARDKTTSSISRRAAYIFNYPQTKVNYSTCLTEIYEDEELMSDFMSRQGDYSKPKVCLKEYCELLDIIIEKYRKKTSEDAHALTSLNFKELLERYDIVLANDVKDPRRYKILTREEIITEDDIKKAVIQSLILGALHAQRYPGYKSSQMFDVFCQYDTAALKDSFKYLRDISVISRKRNAHDLTSSQLNRVMPHVPVSYQLSTVYNRYVVSRMSVELTSDVAQFWNSIKTSERGSVDIPLDPSGGTCALSLLFTALEMGTIEVVLPDQIIVVDLEASSKEGRSSSEKEERDLDQESENEEDEEEGGRDDDEEEDMEKEDAEILKLLSETQDEWSSSTRTLLRSDAKEGKVSKTHIPTLSIIPENSEEPVTNEPTNQMDVSTDSLDLPSTSNQNEKIEKGGLRKTDKREKDAAGTEDSARVRTLSMKHNLLILRDLFKPNLSTRRICHLPEEVVMNPCNLTLKTNAKKYKDYVRTFQEDEDEEQQILTEFVNITSDTFVPFSTSLPLSKCISDLDKWLPVETLDLKTKTWETFKQSLQPPKFQVQLEDLEKIYSFIGRGKFKGATIAKLQEAFPNWAEFITSVKILIQEKMVFEVGLIQLRLVTVEHISDWIVKCPKGYNQNLTYSWNYRNRSDEDSPMDTAGSSPVVGQQKEKQLERTNADGDLLIDATGDGPTVGQQKEKDHERTSIDEGSKLEASGDSPSPGHKEEEQERTNADRDPPFDAIGVSQMVEQQKEKDQERTGIDGVAKLEASGVRPSLGHEKEKEQERTNADGDLPIDAARGSQTIGQQNGIEEERTYIEGGTSLDRSEGIATDATGDTSMDTTGDTSTDATGGTYMDTTGGTSTDATEGTYMDTTGGTSTDATEGTYMDTTGGTSTDATEGTYMDTTGGTSTDATGGTSMDTTVGTSTDATGGTYMDTTVDTSTDATGGTSTDATGGTYMDTTGGTSTDATGGTSMDTTGDTSTDATGGTYMDTTGDTSTATRGMSTDATGVSPVLGNQKEKEQVRITSKGCSLVDIAGGIGSTPMDVTVGSHVIGQQNEVGQESSSTDGTSSVDTAGGSQAIGQQREVGQERLQTGESTSEKDESFHMVTSPETNEKDHFGVATSEDGSELVTQTTGFEDTFTPPSSGNKTLFEKLTTKEEIETMYFGLVGRAFYKIDGTINREQVQEFLTRVASFVVENPGCKEAEITKTLEPVISHIDCLLILQKLTKFGCISRHETQQKRYKGPFTREGHFKKKIYYMPSIDCFCRLTVLMESCQGTH